MSNISFKVLNWDVIRRLEEDGDIVLPHKKVSEFKDEHWNTKQMTSKVLHGILNGDSVQKIAKAMESCVGNNENSAIRNARTMFTSAENNGRLDSYKNLTDQGVVMKKEWEATPDDRTRPSHKDIDGEQKDIDEMFSNGCMFPGDGNGPAEEVWCCRCAMGSHFIGFRRADGSISRINDSPSKTMHEEQMKEESLNRTTNSTIKAARKAERTVTKDLLGAVKTGSGHLEGLDYKLKGEGSLRRKIADKSVKKGLTQEEYSKQITDVLRYTNISEDATFTADFYTVKNELEKKGYSMIEVANTIWDENEPYRGINTLVRNPNGYTFELQFHTPQSLEIKEINHKLYEEQRLATTTEKRVAELDKIMTDNAKAIKTPVDSSKIINKKLDISVEQW